MRKLALTLAAAAALTALAACSSDSKGAADTTSAGTAADTTAGSTDTSTADTTGATAGTVNPQYADYCAKIDDFLNGSNALDNVFGGTEVPTADDVKAAFDEMAGVLAGLEADAPADIKDDVATVNQAAKDMIAFFDAHDYDVAAIATDTSLATEFQNLVDSDTASSASDRLDQWTVANCGFDPNA